MTITQIECFIEAAKTGSFGKAGANLYISQQTISRQIKAMEQELGFPLFDRTKTGVFLTESGKVLFDRWKEMLVEYRSSVDKARDIYLGEDNIVRIGIIENGNEKDEIIKRLIRFNERYPDLEVEYKVMIANELVKSLENGDNNIVFIPSNDIQNRVGWKLIPLNYFHEDIGIVFSNNHPLAKRKTVDVKHLANETIGVLSKDMTPDHIAKVEKLTRLSGITTQINIKEYSSVTSLQMALVTGKCVTIMFHYIVDGIEEKVRFIPLDIDWANHYMMIAYKNDKYAVKAKNIAREFGE